MLTEHLFARGETLPSWMANALQEFLSVGAFGFVLSIADATHLQVVAGANDQAAAVAVHGAWRWNEATVTRAHPGGAAGVYDVFVTAKADNIVSTPLPYTDSTDRSFQLAIVPTGTTPTIVAGTVDIYRKIGWCRWSGSEIREFVQTVPVGGRAAALGAPFRGWRVGAQGLALNTWLPISLDQSDWIGDSQGGRTDVYVAPAQGIYLCRGQVQVPAGDNVGVQAGLMGNDGSGWVLDRKGSVVTPSTHSTVAAFPVFASVFAGMHRCAVGTQLALGVYTNGGSLAIDATPWSANFLEVMRIA